jgi:metal-responsive CopG/Arc/MetJ family transcriptional regulator
MKNVAISISMDAELIRALDEHARYFDVTRSACIARILTAWVGTLDGKQPLSVRRDATRSDALPPLLKERRRPRNLIRE